ncbi:MAG TPA: biotin/lipoyl-containing protein [Gemmatimonadota bacterium]|nr:biotin/lipoyl-containing protein [Gemmatimonadota bacterium]
MTIDADGGGGRATVQRGGERWSFAFAAGPAADTVWIGDRPRRFDWETETSGRGRLVLDGAAHPFTVETEARHRAAGIAGPGRSVSGTREIRAPMPGLVVAVEVADGDRVETGNGIAIIEAMKMENEIMAPVGGRVRDLAIRSGLAVEADALLCRIEPDGEAP